MRIASKLLSKASKEMLRIARNLTYTPDHEMYQDVKVYHGFIGEEIEGNAKFGMQLALNRKLSGSPIKIVVETAAGTGASSRDVHLVVPGVQAICIELSQHLCAEGQRMNPHLRFRAENMCDFDFDRRAVDLAFNSASSLGFLDIRSLHKHLQHMSAVMTDNGQYYCDVGYYSSVQAAYLDQAYVDDGKSSKGKPVKNFNITSKYHPVTDFHHICYSSWKNEGETSKLVEAYGHTLRAYRFSEMEYLAELSGLKARLWTYKWSKDLQRYTFALADESYFVQKADDYFFMIEFYKGNAPGLETFLGENISELDGILSKEL